MGNIVDLSKYQGTVDWPTASKYIDLAIIRVQYGSLTEDNLHKYNETQAKKFKVPFGEYAFGHFVSVSDAQKEANDFLKRIDKEAKFLVLDVESPTIASMGTAHIAEATQAFIDVCKKAGHKIGLYVAYNLYNQYGLNKIKCDFYWLPRYGTDSGKPQTKPAFASDLWQYTSKGSIKGIKGNVDLSKLNGTKDLNWFLGIEKPVVSTIVKVASTATKTIKSVAKTVETKATDTVKEVVNSTTTTHPTTAHVVTNDTASKAIEWAKSKGINDGTNPKDTATHEDVVTLLYRFNNLTK